MTRAFLIGAGDDKYDIDIIKIPIFVDTPKGNPNFGFSNNI